MSDVAINNSASATVAHVSVKGAAAQAKAPSGEISQTAKKPLATAQSNTQRLTEVRKGTVDTFSEVQSNLQEAISEINKALEQRQIAAQISMDKHIDRYIVRITDQSTGELLREVPSEAVQRFARNLEQLKGVLFESLL